MDVWEIFIGGRHNGKLPFKLTVVNYMSKDSVFDVSSSLLPNNGMLGIVPTRWSDANQDGIKDLYD